MKRDRDDEVPGDVLDLVSQKKNSKVAKRERILNEEHVEQEIVDAMIDVTDNTDLRSILKVENGMEIEIKWHIEYEEDDEQESGNYWLGATVINKETGRKHKFIDDDDEEEFTYTPIVQIKYDNDNDSIKDICFISDSMIYDIEEDCVVLWRNKGDDFDDESDPSDIFFAFTNLEELEKEVSELVPNIIINVLSKFKTQYENLPFTVRREWDAHIVFMKDLLVKKIVEFFKKGAEENPDKVMTLGSKELDTIFDECFEEIGAI